MRKLFLNVFLCTGALTLTSCTDLLPTVEPAYIVPADKSAFIGEWNAKSITLVINKDGNVSYEKKGVANVSISGPIKQFTGNNFEIGIGPISTTFVVSVAPHKQGNAWKMTVDGNELTKKQ